MNERTPEARLFGREPLLARLAGVVNRAGREGSIAVVVGQAGIGKTSLVREALAHASLVEGHVGWGTCIDGAGAPGYWPWTQALNGIARAIGLQHARDAAGDDRSILTAIVTALGGEVGSGTEGAVPVLLWDAVARWLQVLAADAALCVVLDDLHWADDSSLQLFGFFATCHLPGVCLIGMYRPDELGQRAQQLLGSAISHADHIQLDGLDATAVHALVENVLGRSVADEVSDEIHRRSAGHPFFARELALLSATPSPAAALPGAVREAIERRLRRFSPPTLAVLEMISMIGNEAAVDVVAGALGTSTSEVELAVRDAVDAGVLIDENGGRLRLAHDLLRETLLRGLDPGRRAIAHQAIGNALERRAVPGTATVSAAEIARHFTAAIQIDGPARPTRWALAAADTDCRALAFTEAAGHLRRLRAGAAAVGVELPGDSLIDVLLAEADALIRSGSPLDATGLLRVARDVALQCSDVRRVAHVALVATQVGSRFATRRDDVISDLEAALEHLGGADLILEARLTATLARELQHSVAEERPRAGPLSARALVLGRKAGDSGALLACLLARHDVLWTPGHADERARVAHEIVAVARRARDTEHLAQGLLLLANAELERGSASYLAALDECLELLDELGQPRHRYTAETRRAALALLQGDLDDAAARIDSATALGMRIREPDTGNVRMSQRLELVRSRGIGDELAAFAGEAIEHWTGAPVHANAVAAGFYARAGDIDRARRHTAVVLDLGTWRVDRSYLWSVFVRELSWAAIALGDRQLCEQLLADVAPLTETCGVNGAVVAFGGSHAHTAGLLAESLGRSDEAERHFAQARAVYQRLGATPWLAELDGRSAGRRGAASRATLRRAGALWQISYAGHQASVVDSKGMGDIAVLLANPGVDVHALRLMGSADASGSAGAMADRVALDAYRRRLADLDDDAEQAARDHDLARIERAAAERDTLLTELRRVTTATGEQRQFANHPAERARKAVSARIRAAMASIAEVLPELADHLDRTIVTGTQCRYAGGAAVSWDVTTET
ncbi:MAG: ATP-binding protein [Ilumatobacteraceae bacterium]